MDLAAALAPIATVTQNDSSHCAVEWDGGSYEGEVNQGLRNGRGVLRLEQPGFTLDGEFKDGLATGKSLVTTAVGTTFSGTLRRGIRNGHGEMHHGDSSYSGEWSDGMRHGIVSGTPPCIPGTMTYTPLVVYEGEWSDGLRQGFGCMAYANGTRYRGEWIGDEKCGIACTSFPATTSLHVGTWHCGRMHGPGVQLWLSPDGHCLSRYTGTFKNGQRCGMGTMEFSSGARFSGEWRDNLRSGIGALVSADGTVVCGSFQADVLVQLSSDAALSSSRGGGVNPHGLLSQPLFALDIDSCLEELRPALQRCAHAQEGASPFPQADISDADCTPHLLTGRAHTTTVRNVTNVLLRWNSLLHAWYSEFSCGSQESSSCPCSKMFDRSGSASFGDVQSRTHIQQLYWRILRCSVLPHEPGQCHMTLGNLWWFLECCGFLHGTRSLSAVDEMLLGIRGRRVAAIAASLQQQQQQQEGHGGVDSRSRQSVLDAELYGLALDAQSAHDPASPVLFREFVELLVRIAFQEACERGPTFDVRINSSASLVPPPPQCDAAVAGAADGSKRTKIALIGIDDYAVHRQPTRDTSASGAATTTTLGGRRVSTSEGLPGIHKSLQHTRTWGAADDSIGAVSGGEPPCDPIAASKAGAEDVQHGLAVWAIDRLFRCVVSPRIRQGSGCRARTSGSAEASNPRPQQRRIDELLKWHSRMRRRALDSDASSVGSRSEHDARVVEQLSLLFTTSDSSAGLSALETVLPSTTHAAYRRVSGVLAAGKVAEFSEDAELNSGSAALTSLPHWWSNFMSSREASTTELLLSAPGTNIFDSEITSSLKQRDTPVPKGISVHEVAAALIPLPNTDATADVQGAPTSVMPTSEVPPEEDAFVVAAKAASTAAAAAIASIVSSLSRCSPSVLASLVAEVRPQQQQQQQQQQQVSLHPLELGALLQLIAQKRSQAAVEAARRVPELLTRIDVEVQSTLGQLDAISAERESAKDVAAEQRAASNAAAAAQAALAAKTRRSAGGGRSTGSAKPSSVSTTRASSQHSAGSDRGAAACPLAQSAPPPPVDPWTGYIVDLKRAVMSFSEEAQTRLREAVVP